MLTPLSRTDKKYLAENVFPAVFRLRESRCAVACPAEHCACNFNSLSLLRFMPPRERARYISLIADVVSAIPRFRMLRFAILDVMTLKCPTCKVNESHRTDVRCLVGWFLVHRPSPCS